MDILLYILAGAAVGLAVGITGVGGGSLMTPLLLLFGFPPHVAVGTDLMYASITKAGGALAHHKQRTIRWRLMGLMAAGSLPAAGVTIFLLHNYFGDPESYNHLLTTSLGFMLILTSGVILLKSRLRQNIAQEIVAQQDLVTTRKQDVLTFAMGVSLGVLVTLSSVGAGAIAAAVLMILYPKLASIKIVGTDLAHAVPLTLIAGLGHMFLGNVDFLLLGSLLIGSLPAIMLGTKLGANIPDKVLHPILASVLMLIGAKYAFF